MEGQVAAGLLKAQEWARLATGSNFLTMAGSSTWMESLHDACIHGLWCRALIHKHFLILSMSSGHELVPLSRWGALDGG